ncbi:hypothetical protein BRADI_3g59713v3 [Brachypodium distachyon]|uniref:Uncharacterized protein n=1 Tax=Brachypodium distachyon TaxID=15368 RepID=A0A2K2D5V0_BRADI|nr:hypothetical protein BRADI_3g59713v3 [Brachypodium distachyon]
MFPPTSTLELLLTNPASFKCPAAPWCASRMNHTSRRHVFLLL